MNSKTDKIYPDSGVELNPFTAKNYDTVMNMATLGLYRGFIHRAIRAMDIQRGDKILDLGCGTGRNACIMAKYLDDNGKITGRMLPAPDNPVYNALFSFVVTSNKIPLIEML